MANTNKAVFATIATLVLTSTASAYVRNLTGVAGDSSPVPLTRADNKSIQFQLNSSMIAGAQSKGKTVISPTSDPVAAVRQALAAWGSIAGADLKFLPLKSTDLFADSRDKQMVIAIATSDADLSVVGGALAVTNYSYSPIDQIVNGVPVAKGTIGDTDILLNPAYTFSTDGSTDNDLQSVLTHELGHAIGANHTNLLGAVMFQLNSGQRFLTTDDLAFAYAAYAGTAAPVYGTISGVVTTTSGAAVAYGLLTAVDLTTGITVGGITNTDGSYSFQVPAGTYSIYAEPLNGVVPVNVYLTADQINLANSTQFQTTIYTGTVAVSAGSTAAANLAVTPSAAVLATPLVGSAVANGYPTLLYPGGPVTVPSGQSVDLAFYGAGFDATLKDSSFTVLGQGMSVHPGGVSVDTRSRASNGSPMLRVRLDITARTTPELASIIVTSPGGTISFSGALVVVPPSPAFISAGVISAAAYSGIQGGVTPGGIYSIYTITDPGGNPIPTLGPAGFVLNGPYDDYGTLATVLGGVSVTFDGVPAPIFLAYGSQLNLQVPFEVSGKTSTTVVVNYLGSASTGVSVPVLKVQPSFFVTPGTTAIRAYNLADGTINSAQNPAPRSSDAKASFVELYGTGVGQVSYPISTGHAAPAPPAGFNGNYTYSIGGLPSAAAVYGGYTPTAAGLAQWDIQIPSNSPTGAVSVVVTDPTGVSSPPGMTIFVK